MTFSEMLATRTFTGNLEAGKAEVEQALRALKARPHQPLCIYFSPSPKEHQGAQETIKILRLDHDNLVHLRRKAIHGFFGIGRTKLLSKREARRLLATIDRPNTEGKLRPFCFVLKPLLEKHSA
jgi:hypothetical protein